jgi:hypothetical protein
MHLRKYGLSREAFDALNTDQSGLCAICLSPPGRGMSKKHLSVDHDHLTGRVRGLLCHHCNAALGGFKDSVVFLLAAVKYLEGGR